MQVYWVESFDHSEDWFVAEESVEKAQEYFADYLGFDLLNDEVNATEVCALPENFNEQYPDFLDNETIIACGGEFIPFHDEDLLEHISEETLNMVAGQTRIVRIANKVYMEGNIMRLALQMEGKLTKF